MIHSPMSTNRVHGYGQNDLDHSPLIVFYEVTQSCDLACLHCRACAQPAPHPNELNPAESRALIDQLTDFPRPPMLVITGGDPLKRSDIYDLISYATRAGLQVSITPSATPLVTDDAIRRLRDTGIVRLAISLDGAHAATHDHVRGVRGVFDRTLRILDSAREAEIPTQVNTTITPNNFEQIDALADLLATQGIVLWSVFFLVPVGRAILAPRLAPDQYEQAFEKLWHHAQHQPYLIKTTEAPHYRRYVIQHQIPKRHGKSRLDGSPSPSAFIPLGIGDGKGVMFVGHTGLIHPSGFMPIVCGLFPLDNVLHVYQSSPIFRGLRDANRLEGNCRICEYRHICGGSRARAYAVTGNPFAQEPDCTHVPTAAYQT